MRLRSEPRFSFHSGERRRRGRRVFLFRDEVHYPIARVASLADCRKDEPRPDSPTLVVRMNVELVELRPPVHTTVEPRGLEGRPHMTKPTARPSVSATVMRLL